MQKFYCPVEDSSESVSIVLNRREARQLFRTLNNASRWEDLTDIDEDFKSILSDMEVHCDGADRQRSLNSMISPVNDGEIPEMNERTEPNAGLDIGIDD